MMKNAMNFNDHLDGEKRQLSKAGRSTHVALLHPDADRSGDDDDQRPANPDVRHYLLSSWINSCDSAALSQSL